MRAQDFLGMHTDQIICAVLTRTWPSRSPGMWEIFLGSYKYLMLQVFFLSSLVHPSLTPMFLMTSGSWKVKTCAYNCSPNAPGEKTYCAKQPLSQMEFRQPCKWENSGEPWDRSRITILRNGRGTLLWSCGGFQAAQEWWFLFYKVTVSLGPGTTGVRQVKMPSPQRPY